ncbi:Two-component system protein B [Lasiodiplodia theobromae]|uniref:histidine kinase n=1 Tax=Lasiodiplodia theobromae TaxID=45133 RepID=A0A5N5D1P8_9PEZI|nr:Two-component system protein B [Lasiodiplodia theobromae]
MLNRWTEQRRPLRLVSLHELDQLEEEIVRGISQVLPEYELVSKSIFFDNRLPVDSLVLNAVQSVQNGSVVVSISAAKGFSKLRFDIIDNGCGMSTATQRRIFEAFEKGDPHTRGAGLGLTVASKIARLMNGTVRLISSEVGHGTHFRVEFDDPGFGCQFGPRPSAQTMFKDIPRKYYEVPNKGGPSDLVQHFTKCIENQGFSRSHTSRGSLNIVSFTSDEKHFHQSLEKLDPSTVSVCLVPSLTTRLLVLFSLLG